MAGAAAERELSTQFAVATRADDAAIRRLLRDNPMPGRVSVTFEREPDYFRGADLAGGNDQTIVASSASRVVCMGRCTQRDCWINGATRRVGYLAELRLDRAARGRFRILQEGYGFFDELNREAPVDLYFTSIAADNVRARRLLERGARGLPSYIFLAELDTLLIAVPRRPGKTKLCLENATPARVPELLLVLNEHGRQHQFATVWTEDNLRGLERHGLPLERFLLAIERDEVVACAALWDQRDFRQTVIRGYPPFVSAVRPLINAAGRILGIPRLPTLGSVLAHAFLSPLAFKTGAEGLLPEIVDACFPHASGLGLDFLTLALSAADSRVPNIRRRFTTRTWRSRLYCVDWSGRESVALNSIGASFLPDVALL